MNKFLDYDLLIIGGGALGTFHAYNALQRGLKVAMFERNARPLDATVRNFGQVVPSGQNLKWQQYGRKSLEIYKSIQAKTNISIRQNGSIYFASNDEELQLIEELHAINKANEYPSELWSAENCYKHYPHLHASYCKGGLYFPEEVSADPRFMIHQVQDLLSQEQDFRYFTRKWIVAIDSVGPKCRVMDQNGRVYGGDKVIVCCGHEFEILYPELFRGSDLEYVKLQMLRLKPQRISLPGNILTGLSIRRYESFQECPSYAAIKANEDPNSFYKKWGIHILFKQESDGSIIIGDSHEYADAGKPEQLDFHIREDINQYFISEGAKIFNLEHWEVDTQWIGTYSQCKEQDIFQHVVDDKVHIVTGIGGKGMTASAGFSFHHLNQIYGYD